LKKGVAEGVASDPHDTSLDAICITELKYYAEYFSSHWVATHM
jgi:hypothetical protein